MLGQFGRALRPDVDAHEQAITELAGQIFTKFERWFRKTAG